MKPQFYKHDKTEAEQLAETQPIIGKKTAARALEIQEEVDANMMNKHEQVGKVKPTIADERSDLRIVRGGDITANSNFGQSGINETDNDKQKIRELNLQTKYNLKEAYDNRTKRDLQNSKESVAPDPSAITHMN